MKLKEELNKPEYDLTSYQIEHLVDLFKRFALEMVGEDANAKGFDDRGLVSGDIETNNDTKQEIRQRIKLGSQE